MPTDNKHDPFNDKVRAALDAQGGEKQQQQPERSAAEPGQEREAGASRQQGATPNPADVDRFTEALKKEWGIGSDGKAEHAQEQGAADRSERPTASAVPPTRDPRAFEGTSIDAAWTKLAAGTRNALGDFVTRVLWNEPGGTHEPGDKLDKGMDR